MSLTEFINKRLEIAGSTALRNAKKRNESKLQASFRLAGVAADTSVANKKIFWFRRASDEFHGAYAEHSACRKGCSHCCHIGVCVSRQEAKMIALATGNRLNEVRTGIHSHIAIGYDNPCPFLVEGTCSIYEHRPIMCRIQLNMDADELLCRLVEDGAVSVPYADNRHIHIPYSYYSFNDYADIREWFA